MGMCKKCKGIYSALDMIGGYCQKCVPLEVVKEEELKEKKKPKKKKSQVGRFFMIYFILLIISLFLITLNSNIQAQIGTYILEAIYATMIVTIEPYNTVNSLSYIVAVIIIPILFTGIIYIVKVILNKEYKKPIFYIVSSLIIIFISFVLITNRHLEEKKIIVDFDNLVTSYNESGKYDKALEYSFKILKLKEKFFSDNTYEIMLTYQRIHYIYFDMQDYKKSILFNKKILEIAKSDTKFKFMIVSAYNNIGWNYLYTGKYLKAIEYAQKSLNINKEKKYTEEMGTSYITIGVSYNSLGNYIKALDYSKKALIVCEQQLGTEDLLTARSYEAMATIYKDLGDYKKALEYTQKSLKIKETRLGKRHPDTAGVYTHLAGLYHLMYDGEKSMEFYMRALEIYRQCSGTKYLDIASIYHNVGVIYLYSGEYENALDYLKEGKKIFEQVEPNHPNLISSYLMISNTYTFMNKYNKAFEYSNRALILSKKNFGENHLSTASTYNSLAQIKLFDFDYKSSYSYAKKAFDIFYKKQKNIFNDRQKDSYLKRNSVYIETLLHSSYQYQKTLKNNRKILEYIFHNWINYKDSILEKNISKEQAFKAIIKNLKNSELYIDYAKAGNYYYIFTLNKKEEIGFIQIDENSTKKIDSIIMGFKEEIQILAKNTKNKEHLTQSSKEKLVELYTLLIKNPLKDRLDNKATLIISPDGVLQFLLFEILYDDEKQKYLIENREIRYISSVKELI